MLDNVEWPIKTGYLKTLTLNFIFLLLLSNHWLFGQIDTVKVEVVRMERLDTVSGLTVDTTAYFSTRDNSYTFYNSKNLLTAEQRKRRSWIVGASHVAVYTGSLLALNQAWYADYPRSSFHFFNDNAEWLQIDKVGHAWSAYHESRVSKATWKWAGLSHKQQIWLGGLSGVVFQTVIETLDGFSSEWGWSWGDIAANFVGSGLLIGQELGWGEQRISFKWGFHKKNYDDPMLEKRTNELHGKSLQERALKDYNGQTYWMSVNMKSFFKQSKLPGWLNIAVGYGADGMFGAEDNKWEDKDNPLITYDRSDIKRVRQFYLAPDIDFTRIPTKKKWLKTVFFVLNAFKLPSPALALSGGKLQVKGFYF